MPLSARVIAVTLFAMALGADDHVVSISRRALGELAGVHKPAADRQAVREMEAIGLFAVDRGIMGDSRVQSQHLQVDLVESGIPGMVEPGVRSSF